MGDWTKDSCPKSIEKFRHEEVDQLQPKLACIGEGYCKFLVKVEPPMKKNCPSNSPENTPANSPSTVLHSPRIRTVEGELHLFNLILKNSRRTVEGE